MPHGMTLRLTVTRTTTPARVLSAGASSSGPHWRPPSPARENIIAGNVIGYGATSGEIFVSGVVGERCGVRNSGATIIVEGTGDHACEYMDGRRRRDTRAVGRNLAAGMSGGTLYLYDPDQSVYDHLSAGVYENRSAGI